MALVASSILGNRVPHVAAARSGVSLPGDTGEWSHEVT